MITILIVSLAVARVNLLLTFVNLEGRAENLEELIQGFLRGS